MNPLAFNEILLERLGMAESTDRAVARLTERSQGMVAGLGADHPACVETLRELAREVAWQEHHRVLIAALELAIRCTPQQHDGTEEQIGQAAAPHEEALARIYNCSALDVWDACEKLRLARLAQMDFPF